MAKKTSWPVEPSKVTWSVLLRLEGVIEGVSWIVYCCHVDERTPEFTATAEARVVPSLLTRET